MHLVSYQSPEEKKKQKNNNKQSIDPTKHFQNCIAVTYTASLADTFYTMRSPTVHMVAEEGHTVSIISEKGNISQC